MNTRRKLNIGIWVLVIIILLLLATTTAVLAMRIGGYLPQNTDVIFLHPRDPNVWVEDENGNVWDQTETIEIFSMEYANEKNELVVKSMVDSEAVIAPGVETSYKFYLKNTGNFALDFSVLLDPKLIQHSEVVSLEELPFEVRVHNQNGEYLIGNEEEWVKIADAPSVVDEGVVGKNSYYSYVFEWRWEFEDEYREKDAHDTYLGNLTINEPVVMQIDLGLTAAESTSFIAQGGLPIEDLGETGGSTTTAGTINWWPFILLLLLLACALTALITLVVRKKKENSTR